MNSNKVENKAHHSKVALSTINIFTGYSPRLPWQLNSPLIIIIIMIVANMKFSFLIGQLDSDLRRKSEREEGGERNVAQPLVSRRSVSTISTIFPLGFQHIT